MGIPRRIVGLIWLIRLIVPVGLAHCRPAPGNPADRHTDPPAAPPGDTGGRRLKLCPLALVPPAAPPGDTGGRVLRPEGGLAAAAIAPMPPAPAPAP